MKKLFLLTTVMLLSLFTCVAQEQPEDTIINTFVEVFPEYPGGPNALNSFLSQVIEYPEAARIQGITGTVLVGLVIEKDGSVSNVRVVVPLSPALDEAAVQGIQKMPKWKPGTVDGKPVRTDFRIPITFSMSKSDIRKAQKEMKKKQKK